MDIVRNGGTVERQKRSHLLELNITRGLAILAVLIIHSTSIPVTTLDMDSKYYIFYVALNMFSKFAVPAFIFLSGLVLFYNYIDRDMKLKDVKTFYKKRLSQVILPFVIFSLFYYIFVQVLGSDMSFSEAYVSLYTWDFWYKFLTGNMFYHLYFIFIILQFYILFPLLLVLFQRYKKMSQYMIWIGLLIQLLYLYIDMHYLNMPVTLLFSFFGYFLLGGYIGIHYHAWKKWLYPSKFSLKSFILLGFTWLVWLSSSLYNTYLYKLIYGAEKYIHSAFEYRLLFDIESITACLLLLQVSIFIYDKTKILSKFLTALGVYSFGIYLLHPYLLYLYNKIPIPTDMNNFHLYILGSLLTTLFGTWLVVWVIANIFPWYYIIFGSLPIKHWKNKAKKSV